MPSLPRIRSRRGAPAGAPDVAARPRITELQGDNVTWIDLLAPTAEEAQLLAGRFGWHPLDVEDVLSRRQRPKVDVYADDPVGGYLFAVLHFPVYDAGVGRLNAGELEHFQTALRFAGAEDLLRLGDKAEAARLLRGNWRGSPSFVATLRVLARILTPYSLMKYRRRRRQERATARYGSLDIFPSPSGRGLGEGLADRRKSSS